MFTGIITMLVRSTADAQLWVEMTDAALCDLRNTKSDLASSKSALATTQEVVQYQNSVITRQTSKIEQLVEVVKASRGAQALRGLAELVQSVSPEFFSSTARTIAAHLDTEGGGG